ncbi:DMP19 family protein [uncultured Veillonella sp.]|uniref:DMP19 family protein n=1 Tax=uncultured Veillonella sp. TaxID=159268 RepID=UPI00288B15EF|nr:DMP19 family protein [uncultured Veillonella sp.]
MSMSVEQFLSLSDAEQLQTIKDLNDIGQEDIIIDVLTGVGIDNLSAPLLGELGRAYNNNDKPEEAIKVFKAIDKKYRDAVWHYRYAYSYGSIVSSNREAYTSENMQQMLALVDSGVQLATKEGRNDIREYCLEVKDMCRLEIDFEKCEVDYPDLCLNYSKYIAEKKKKREGVPRQRTITVEEILATDDMWTINEPAYWTINIYGSYDDYLESAKGFTVEQRYLNAICWYFAEVNNGGHHQFFYNSTGIVWEDALVGLRLFKMDILADNLQSVIDYFGGSVPFDRAERWTILQDWENEAKLFDFLDVKDDVVYEYDGKFEDVFVHEHPELFVFDGTYTVSE